MIHPNAVVLRLALASLQPGGSCTGTPAECTDCNKAVNCSDGDTFEKVAGTGSLEENIPGTCGPIFI